MMVLKLEMWPMGRHEKARCIGIATFSLVGLHQATKSRGYDVVLFKAPQFGGPGPDEVERIKARRRKDVWRTGRVAGHTPGVGKRGTWDLIGGALNVLLGRRLQQYFKAEDSP
jgi:hypothetical protein